MVGRLLLFALLLPLIAVAAPATQHPLFVPPKGMVRVAHAPFEEKMLAGTPEHLVAAYRGNARAKWNGRYYTNAFYITVRSVQTAESAAGAGISRMSYEVNPPQYDLKALLAQDRAYCLAHAKSPAYCTHFYVSQPPAHKRLAARALPICGNRTGWFNEYQSPGGDNVEADVYASSGSTLYIASTSYSKLTGDVFHAVGALRSLCPQADGSTLSPTLLPASSGWFAGGTYQSSYPDLTVTSSLVRLGSKTTSMEFVTLFEGSDTSEYITPEQEAAVVRGANTYYYRPVKIVRDRAQRYCGQDGWHTLLRGKSQGYPYVVETQAAYANDMSYVLVYAHRAEEADDPAARRILSAFCPLRYAPAAAATPTTP